MGRLERFRQLRRFKRRKNLALLFFFIFSCAGLLISDYSINAIMRNQKSVRMVTVSLQDRAVIKLGLFDKTYILDMSRETEALGLVFKRTKELFREAWKSVGQALRQPVDEFNQ